MYDLRSKLDSVISQAVANAVDDLRKTLSSHNIGMTDKSWDRLVDDLATKVTVKLEV